MKIGFVTEEFPPKPHGGIGIYIRELGRALLGQGHDVHIIEPTIGPATDCIREGFHVHSISVRTGTAAAVPKRLILRRAIENLSQQHGIDILEIPDYQGLVPLPVVGLPTVVRLHLSARSILSSRGQRPWNALTTYFETFQMNRIRDWFGVSMHSINEATQTFGHQPNFHTYHYIPIFPTREDYTNPPMALAEEVRKAGKYILVCGHVTKRKGAHIVSEAFNAIATTFPDLKLVLVGQAAAGGVDCPMQEIQVLRHQNRILFLGPRPREECLGLMKRAEMICCISNLETLALTAIEAMCVGTPVVATAVPPFTEYLHDGKSGLLCAERSPEIVAEQMTRILRDRSVASRLATGAKEVIESSFCPKRIVDLLCRDYSAVIGGTSKQ